MMKRIPIYLTLILSCITMMSGCVDIQEFEEPVQKVSKVFYADMEENATTKTVLGAKDEDRTRAVLWSPEDKIGVVPVSGGSFDLFVNKNTEASIRAIFEGQTVLAQRYFAVYPYDESATITDGSISFTLSGEQVYKADSFDQNAFPMIARSSDINTDGLKFSNLCGLLEVNLTGEEKITKITFSSDKIVSGKFTVDTGYEEYPEIIPDVSGSTSATLNCGEGVQLNVDSPTPFYLVLPPGIYEKFTVIIQTSDGNLMFKQSKNPLNIKRSRTAYAGALEYVESTSFNLSSYGNANCYIVSHAGMYCFDASVIGNGAGGIISDASFHTKNPTISPASVEVLWEAKGANVKAEKGELLYNVVLKDGFVHFISTGVEGNALVAVKGAKGSTIWSWHLWFTDSPSEHKYVNSNGSYIVMDRNLGAIRADRGSGEEWKESYGTIYQWGRKDPFIKETYELMRSTNIGSGPFSLSHAIQNPTKIGVMNGGAMGHPSWLDVKNNKLWSNSVKTIYDPCPVGYMVPDTYIWKGFTIDGEDASFWESINASDIKDHGFDFIYDGVNSAWYPAAPMVDWNGGYSNPDKIGRLWTTVPERSFKYETSPAITFNNTECWENYAIPVRCVKDEGYIDISYPQVIVTRFEDITSSSVKVVAEVKSEGISEVTERGIIWGTTEDLSDGTKVTYENAGGGSFTVALTGLTNATKYYVRSYAVNSRGESQSAVKGFRTWNSDDKSDLSAGGASNCYIVSSPGIYRFDASVKGNSDEQITTPFTPEVLWETISCTDKAESGTILSSVKMDAEYVEFIVPSPLQEGNSVIAVKDMSGNILWSWHIWVTDQPQEQQFSNSTGDYFFLDRNLGATRADRGTGDEWEESVGALYQWGRKDPFIKGLYRSNRSIKSVENSILHPTDHASLNSWNYSSYWESNNNKSLWTPDSKTMYDPCPPGYTVADIDAYYEIKVDSELNKGYYIHLTSTDSWFPVTPIIWCDGSYLDASSDITLWSSCVSSKSFYRLQIPRDDKQYWLSYDNSAMASPVRCMRDNN